MHEVSGMVLSVLNILTHLIITTHICILEQGNQTEQGQVPCWSPTERPG